MWSLQVGLHQHLGYDPAMAAAPRRRIRPVSRETRFLRLRSLKCFKEAHQRILEGWSTHKVAEFIQNDCKEYTDISVGSLDKQLDEYRASLPRGALVKERLPRVFAEAAKTVEEEFDSLVEMKKLYKMQMERIEIDLKIEKGMGKLMPQSMTQEMRAAREILHDISELEMDLGVSERKLGKVDIEARVVSDVVSRYDDAVGKAMGSPESRRKLLGIAERFLSLASGENVLDQPEEVEAEVVEVAPADVASDVVSSEESVAPADEVVAAADPEVGS